MCAYHFYLLWAPYYILKAVRAHKLDVYASFKAKNKHSNKSRKGREGWLPIVAHGPIPRH